MSNKSGTGRSRVFRSRFVRFFGYFDRFDVSQKISLSLCVKYSRVNRSIGLIDEMLYTMLFLDNSALNDYVKSMKLCSSVFPAACLFNC